MKILHTVESYPPHKGGMAEVVRQLSERLVAFGHEVTVATSYNETRNQNKMNGVEIKEFKISGNVAEGMQGEIESYRSFLLQSSFDIITSFAAQQWASDIMFEIMDQINAKKVFVPTGFSGLYIPRYKDYFQKMESWMKKYDMNVFLSDNYRDNNYAKDHGIIKTVLIPNGADEREFKNNEINNIRLELGIPKDHFLILHVGSHTGMKGHAETIKIFKKTKIIGATLVIVGNVLDKNCYKNCKQAEFFYNMNFINKNIRKKRILIKELDRNNLVNLYKEADLFLFPSNMECSPIVLFEAMASKTPFLVSDVGNSTEIIEWSKGGLLLPTDKDVLGRSRVRIKESITILEELCRNEISRQHLSDCGYKAFIEKFTWDVISKKYELLYKGLLE